MEKGLGELLNPFLQLEVNVLKNTWALRSVLNERGGISFWWPQL